jgi:chromosome segregation ATPase
MTMNRLVALTLAGGVASSTVTPVEKVIELLKDMKSKLQDEGSGEATTYDEFACYCKDTTEKKSGSIKDGQTTIDTVSAELVDKTAQKGARETDLGEAKTKLEGLKIKLKETEVRCAKEKAEYETKDADLTKAIESIENAKNSLESSKPAAAAAGLLTMKHVIEKTPVFEDAMKTLEAGPKWSALLQHKTKVDPSDPDYKFKSQELIDLLQKLHEDFTKEKEERDEEFAKAEKACDDTKADLASEIETTEGNIDDLKKEIGSLTERIAEARGELVEANNLLKDDKLYLTDLTEICETRANQYDQRSQMRAGELGALTQALELLEGSVAKADESVNKRALLQHSKGKSVLAFLQESSKHVVMVQEHVRAADASSQKAGLELRLQNAIEGLRSEGTRLNSVALSALAARAGKDPFAKVKGLIQKLVERLIAEATAEATKKGFCDTELGKAKTQRGFRLEETNRLSAEIGALETKQDALELEIEELEKAIEDLKAAAEEAATLRDEQKEQNVATLKEAREGLGSITEAIGILKTFYKQAAKAASMVQTKASPIEEDNPGAGFSGSYKGNQAASKGVIGLLEVIKTDFQHTIQVTEATEKKQAADYVEFDRVTQADIGAKTTKHELDTADLKTTKLDLEQKTTEMKSNMDLVDEALKEIEELKPTCIDNVMSYADRVKKREEEISALKKALCQLDGEGVEAECQ